MKTFEKIRTKILAAIIILSAAPIFSSCMNDDPNDGIRELVSLVTYDGIINGNARFTMPLTNDQAAITLISDRTLGNDNLKAGQRMVIRYTSESAIEAGNTYRITILFYNPVPTVDVVNADSQTAQAANAEMPLQAIERTGTYINMEVYLPSFSERTYEIYADEATLDNPMTDLYVTTQAKGTPSGTRQIDLVSFDISTVWNRVSCRGVRIHINNTSSQTQTFEFEKYSTAGQNL